MFSKVLSGAVDGIESYLVNVEADVCNGMPECIMVGSLSSEVREAKDRVRTAIKNSGYDMPPKRITINIAPADVKKYGTSYDLPIAISILASLGTVSQEILGDTLIVGELSLGGRVMRVNGILPIIYNAKKLGIKRCIVPIQNSKEGAVIEGVEIVGVRDIRDAVEYVNGIRTIDIEHVDMKKVKMNLDASSDVDFSDIHGQELVKRAIEIAVCGGHNILLVGPPGSGKTMAAKRIPSIMQNMSIEESIEISKTYSVCGLLDNNNSLVYQRPFRAPHHTITTSALAGGGTVPKPGEISLASGGVLFLDELTEYKREVIEILRQPLEDKSINISRINASYTYPADFLLVAAMNPCHCGYYPDRTRCHCTPNSIKRYLGKLSKPFLDRIDMCVETPRVDYNSLNDDKKEENSKDIRLRITAARELQMNRYADDGISYNAQLSSKLVKKYCKLDEEEKSMMERAYSQYELSARNYYRILKVARTIADLDASEDIKMEHLREALCFRGLDKKYMEVAGA